MKSDQETLLNFLRAQASLCGGNLEIDTGIWAVFAVKQDDEQAQILAESLLAGAPFPYAVGISEDDSHVLYHVGTADRAMAVYWLDDLLNLQTGNIRRPSPAQQQLIDEVVASEKPHRAARQLADLHESGGVTAGLIRQSDTVRALLDRLHSGEPLFYNACQILLEHDLIDMLSLFQKLIVEDIAQLNEIVKRGLSRDPFLQIRQDSTAIIRNRLIAYRIINPMDQMKNLGLKNPYAAYMGIAVSHDTIIAPIDGLKVDLPRDLFVAALHSVRYNLYQGQAFQSFNTQSPWVTETIALPFRFIRQQLSSRDDLSSLDALYMLERALGE